MTKPRLNIGMSKLRLSLMATWIILLWSNSGQANSLDVLGTAFNLDTKQILYTESHHISLNSMGQPESSHVSYHGISGSNIGEKILRFYANRLMPDYSFRDFRLDTSISVQARGGRLFVELFDGYVVSKKTLELDSDRIQVIDAGLSWLIKKRWKQLLEGEELEVDLLALTKAHFVTFNMKVTNNNADDITITLDPASFLVRFFVGQIEFRYHKKTQLLKSFSGVRSIPAIVDKDNVHKNFETYLEYSHPGA